jgi:hypothetical protein
MNKKNVKNLKAQNTIHNCYKTLPAMIVQITIASQKFTC